MQAIVFDHAGEPAEVLRLNEMATPRLADGDVLVQVAARPIHPADLAFIRGQYRARPQFPQVAGLEGAGVVAKCGPGVKLAEGTRVAFRWPGSWAEFAAVPLARITPVPAGVSDHAACQVSLNAVTAWGLIDETRAKPGEWILLTAATSVVSKLAAAIAKRRGIRTIGLVRSTAEEARPRCATDQVLSVGESDLAARITEIMGGAHSVALLDSVGGPLVPKLFPTLRQGARVIAYGVQDREPATITNGMLIYSNLTWIGFGIDHWLSQLGLQSGAGMFAELWTMVGDGTLALPVAATYPLRQVRDALAADAVAGRRGKVLLV